MLKNLRKSFSSISLPLRPPSFWLLDGKSFPTETKTTTKEMLRVYEEMVSMRKLEILADQYYKEKKIHGFCHTFDGEEGLGLGLHLACTHEDPIISGYRIHSYAYLRGIPPV